MHPATFGVLSLLRCSVLDYGPILPLFDRSGILGLTSTPDTDFDIGARPPHSLVVILLWLILLRVEQQLLPLRLLIIVREELVYRV